MGGPWEDFQSVDTTPAETGPWSDYTDVTPAPAPAPEQPGLLSRTATNIGKAWTEATTPVQSVGGVGNEPLPIIGTTANVLEKGLRVAGDFGAVVGDWAATAAKTAYKYGVSPQTQKSISDTVDYLGSTDIANAQKETLGGLSDAYSKLSPRIREDVAAGLNTMNLFGLAALVRGAGSVAEAYSASKLAPEVLNAALDKAVTKGIEKGIRPTVVGKGNIGQIEAYAEKAKTAVTDIIGNKDNLILTDSEGNAVQGMLPQSLKQFSEAIDQTKKGIFQQYDALTTSAGEQGAKVDLAPAVKELNAISGKKTLQDLNPEIAKYAQTRAATLADRGAYTTTEAQDAITQLNKSLEAFYKTPSYELAQKAGVDAVIVNNLRSSLDAVIENTTGGGYQALKNSYGSLKAIEKEVAHRAVVDARKNIKGLIDFTDIATAGELVAAVTTMNPALMGKAAAWYGAKRYIKFINNPNNIVQNMFGDAEKILNKMKPIGPTGPAQGTPPLALDPNLKIPIRKQPPARSIGISPTIAPAPAEGWPNTYNPVKEYPSSAGAEPIGISPPVANWTPPPPNPELEKLFSQGRQPYGTSQFNLANPETNWGTLKSSKVAKTEGMTFGEAQDILKKHR